MMKKLIAKFKELVELYEQDSVKKAGEPKVPVWLKNQFTEDEKKALGGCARNRKHWEEYQREHPDTEKGPMVEKIFKKMNTIKQKMEAQLSSLEHKNGNGKNESETEKNRISELKRRISVVKNILSFKESKELVERVQKNLGKKKATELTKPHYVDPRLVKKEGEDTMMGEEELDAVEKTKKDDFDEYHSKKASKDDLYTTISEELVKMARELLDED